MTLVVDVPSEQLIRLDVGDRADRDTGLVSDKRKFLAVRVCAEEQTVRIRRAEIQLENGRWQRLFVLLALKPGQCSKPIDVLRAPLGIRAVQFDDEALAAGYDRVVAVACGQAEPEK